jgi:YVTN family beta-propeller protein
MRGRSNAFLALATVSALAGCGDDGMVDPDAGPGNDAGEDGGPPPADAGVPVYAEEPSKGGPIAVNEAGDTLAVANGATDDVTLFALPELTERARIAVGDQPVSVVFSAEGSTLYVVNRASADVMIVAGANGASPSIAGTIDVGAEPGMGALSPSGTTLYVSNWADGTLSIVDTRSRSVDTLDLGGAPFAVCVSNDGDEEDSDETVFVTDFYALGIDGQLEATDRARRGRVFRVSAGDHSIEESLLSPVAVTGVEPGIDSAMTSAYPNQLYSCAVNNGWVYVTSVGASPASFMGATDFRQNVHGLVHVLDAATGSEVPERTVNLSQLVTSLAAPKRFVAVPIDVAFVPGSDFGYIASLASDSVLRVDWSVSPPRPGSPSGASFLATGQSPIGIAISGSNAYTVNETGRSVTHIDLATQTTPTLNVESAPQPSGSAEVDIHRGQRFFNTGLARWSANGWVACVACHPMGTTDNVTWSFPAGPRQTVDTSATFDSSGGVQRVLNWTAIFDEIHDFELNTRGVANGTGAIVSTTDLNMDGTPNTAARIDFVGPGGIPNPQNGFNVGSSAAVARTGATPEDWDQIEAYLRALRSPRGREHHVAADPEAGRAVFMEAGCQNCHGGPLWTLSELYYTPIMNGDLRTLTLAAAGVSDLGDVRADQVRTLDPSAMRVLENDANGAPQRHSCVVRRVGTFDADGPRTRGAAEVRQNGAPAQGVDGFNVPSLLAVNLGGPYLHHGAAETLEELLDPRGAFQAHLRAGNQVFAPDDQELADLIAFVRSIDDETAPIPVPAGQRFCPEGVVPPVP